MMRGWVLVAVMIVGLRPAGALAASTLTVVMGGEGFEGPPTFTVSFDGKPIGQGTLSGAIDSSKDGRFADAADKSKYVTHFDFVIPDAAFTPQGVVAIRLTNAQPARRDARELFVQSVSVNGKTLPASSLSMRSDAGVEPTAMLGDYLVVSADGVEGIALPADGWPRAATAAAAPATPEPAVPAGTPVAVATVAPSSTTAGGSDTAIADPADANPDPEANEPECGINRRFDVTGFSRNSNELTPRAMKALDVVAKTIGTQKCVVHITGYSSTEGDYAHNALFSIERSQKALHYLAAQGVKFRKYSANGVGETTQFGQSASANRRVVVAVSP